MHEKSPAETGTRVLGGLRLAAAALLIGAIAGAFETLYDPGSMETTGRDDNEARSATMIRDRTASEPAVVEARSSPPIDTSGDVN